MVSYQVVDVKSQMNLQYRRPFLSSRLTYALLFTEHLNLYFLFEVVDDTVSTDTVSLQAANGLYHNGIDHESDIDGKIRHLKCETEI